LYYIDTNNFINDNNTEDKKIIDNWLSTISKRLEIKPTDKVVIISPCHESNTEFINLVNDKVFNSSATIIHYQIGTDYLENFKLLNKKQLDREGIKIFFVDDSLKTGKHFFEIYDLYRHTTEYKNLLSGAIFLKNKSTPDIHMQVRMATNENTFSFVNLNLPFSHKIFGINPLAHEVKRYRNIAETALNDVVKKSFKNKANNIDSVGENGEKETQYVDKKQTKHITMLKATHKVYEYLHKKTDLQKETLESLLVNCGFSKNLENMIAMMKVLSQYPFLLYLPIRKRVFEWHKEWLGSIIKSNTDKLKQSSDTYHFTYFDFQEFKFLIRRGVFLSNYEILSSVFFELIALILDTINAPKKTGKMYQHFSIENSKSEDEKINALNFHIFLLIQYVELIHQNSWCAFRILENLKHIETKFDTTQQGKQFIRMLRIETAVVSNDFYDMLRKEKEWRCLYHCGNDCDNCDSQCDIDIDVEKIKGFFKDNKNLLESKKFEVTNNVLDIKSSNELKPQFLNFLWTKQFLNTDEKKKKIRLPFYQEKIDKVFAQLKGLFEKNSEIGAFFIVTDRQENPHLLYDRDENDNRFLKEYNEERHQIINSFLVGEPDNQDVSKKSIIEYEKIGDNTWKDKYITDKEEFKSFVNDYNSLLMIRISNDKSETLGLMGFYSKENLYNDWLAKQLLMLLRVDIASFITKHHKNEEFSRLREEEIKNHYAYLAGHGRQTMQRLAKRGKHESFRVAIATMEKLQYLFATKYVEPSGNSRKTKDKLSEELLKSFVGKNITHKDLSDLVDMSKEIYDTPIIENNVNVISTNNIEEIDSNLSFPFNKEIFAFICFELIINAKKNRYHFLDNCQCADCNQNELDIHFEVGEDKLIVSITNTGTFIPEHIKNKINGGDSVKDDKESAGLYLITKVIKMFNDKNSLSIEDGGAAYKNCCKIYKNTVFVELNSMNDGE
jgi:hypothetical protein